MNSSRTRGRYFVWKWNLQSGQTFSRFTVKLILDTWEAELSARIIEVSVLKEEENK